MLSSDSPTSKCVICGNSCIRPTSNDVSSLGRARHVGQCNNPLRSVRFLSRFRTKRAISWNEIRKSISETGHVAALCKHFFSKGDAEISSRFRVNILNLVEHESTLDGLNESSTMSTKHCFRFFENYLPRRFLKILLRSPSSLKAINTIVMVQ